MIDLNQAKFFFRKEIIIPQLSGLYRVYEKQQIIVPLTFKFRNLQTRKVCFFHCCCIAFGFFFFFFVVSLLRPGKTVCMVTWGLLRDSFLMGATFLAMHYGNVAVRRLRFGLLTFICISFFFKLIFGR